MKFALTFWNKSWYQYDPADPSAPLLAKVNQMDRFGMLLVCLDTVTLVPFRRRKGSVVAEQPVIGKIDGSANLANVVATVLGEAADESLPVFIVTNDSIQSGKPLVEHTEIKYDGGADDYHHYRASVKDNRELVLVQTPVPLTHMSLKEEFNMESDLMQVISKFVASKEIPLIGIFSATQIVLASIVGKMTNEKTFTDAGVLAMHLTESDKLAFVFKGRDVRTVELFSNDSELDDFCSGNEHRIDVVFPGARSSVDGLKCAITLEQILSTAPVVVGKAKYDFNDLKKPYFYKDMAPVGGDFVQPVPSALKPVATLLAATFAVLLVLNVVTFVNAGSAKDEAKQAERNLKAAKKKKTEAESEFKTVQKGYYSYIWARNLSRYNAQTAKIAQAVFGEIAKEQPIEHAEIRWDQQKESIQAEFDLSFIPSGDGAMLQLQNQIKTRLRNIPAIEGLARAQDPSVSSTTGGIRFGVEFIPVSVVNK